MEGILRKTVNKVSILQRNMFPKRYFIVDFTQAVIYITHHQVFGSKIKYSSGKVVKKDYKYMLETDKKKIVIPFRSVIGCYKPGSELA